MSYPDQLHLAAVDLARKQHNRILELEAELKLLEEMNAKLREQNKAVDLTCARREAIESAARKVVAAFEAFGNAQNAGSPLMERCNCETSMVALKAALLNVGAPHASAGKSRARFEVLAVVVVLYFGIAMYGRMAGA